MELFSVTSLLILIVTFLLVKLYIYGFTRPDIFTLNGIPIVQPVYPFVGSSWGIWKKFLGAYDAENRQKYGKIWGHYEGRKPVLMIADADMVRQLLVKDFEVFTNHNNAFEDAFEGIPVARKFLAFVRGEEWKKMRSQLSPVFTTGKLKKIIHLIDECALNLVTSFKDEARNTGGHVEVRKQLKAYQLDVIATSAFGTKLNAMKNPDNEFVKNAEKIGASEFNKPLGMLIFFAFPQIFKLFPIKPVVDCTNFFSNIVRKIISQRMTEEGFQRGDMLDALLQTAKENPDMDEETLLATSVSFILAGNETMVNAVTWAIYFMTVHEDVQDRVYSEVKEQLDDHEGKVTSEVVSGCKYLEQVTLESLRMYSPAVRVDRGAARDYNYKGIHIPKGTAVNVAIHAIHRDPDYFEDPDTFNPDRFSKENRQTMHPTAYLAFSIGPRNCIGMRLALEVIAVTLIRLVTAYRFVKGTKSKYPIGIGAGMIAYPEEFHFGLEPREG